jgi:hypothetical protein
METRDEEVSEQSQRFQNDDNDHDRANNINNGVHGYFLSLVCLLEFARIVG